MRDGSGAREEKPCLQNHPPRHHSGALTPCGRALAFIPSPPRQCHSPCLNSDSSPGPRSCREGWTSLSILTFDEVQIIYLFFVVAFVFSVMSKNLLTTLS